MGDLNFRETVDGGYDGDKGAKLRRLTPKECQSLSASAVPWHLLKNILFSPLGIDYKDEASFKLKGLLCNFRPHIITVSGQRWPNVAKY
eukprot:scaffold152581_cov14-Prasinocladus_malaysianus.AAC.1